MEDKKYDTYFDEKSDGLTPQEKLMAMVTRADKGSVQEAKAGDRVSGKVLSVGKEYIFVEIGLKNEAMIRKAEFVDKEGNCTAKQGDEIQAFVVSTEKDEIVLSTVLSKRKGKKQDFVEAMNNKIPVEGRVTGVNKGGFNVNVMDTKAFCPFSHIDTKFVDTPNEYLSKTFQFVITRVENRGRNVVLSRLPLLEKNLDARLAEIQEQCKVKKVISGTVTKITDFGLFLDIGDFEGLVHISEVSWDRAENLAASFKEGQIVDCVILKVEKKEPLRNSKISLSIRMTSESPWESVSDKLAVGASVGGTISRLTKSGAFVHLLPGIEGFIHISELSWERHVRTPADVVSEGAAVNVTVLAIDKEKRTVSCSLKDIADDPWKKVSEKYQAGAKVTGTVASDTKYGFFIDLDEAVTGLLPHVKIGKDKKGTITVGSQIEVDIEDVDTDNRRISLSYGAPQPVEMPEKEQKAAPYRQAPLKKQTSEFAEALMAAISKKK